MTAKERKRQADEIVSKMTKEQKLAQLVGVFSGKYIPEDYLKSFVNGMGEVSVMPDGTTAEEEAERCERDQNSFLETSGIPAIRHNEAAVGLMEAMGTAFPLPIGVAASFNPENAALVADTARQQMLATGMRHALSPVMDVVRDPRWGRVGETFGEDPTLCAAMSVAFVKALQTDDLRNGVLATGKHFLGYAMGEGGLNMAASDIPSRELREVYVKPFQAAITEADLATVMNSYGVIDGELVIAAKSILTDLLRGEMGFDGAVVSDYMSINKMTDLHVKETPEEAGLEALIAGLDSELPMPYGYNDKMLGLIEGNPEAEAAFDRAVHCMIEAKLKLGLFDNPYARKDLLAEAYDVPTMHERALKTARESVVLVRNNGILPLDRKKKKIAVIGPHADSLRLLFGYYTYPACLDRDMSGSMADMPGMAGVAPAQDNNPYQMPFLEGSNVRGTHPDIEELIRQVVGYKTPTILEALRKEAPEIEWIWEKGCEVAGTDRKGFAAAIRAVESADLVIVVGGGKSGWGSNCTTGEGIDTDRVGLPGVQEELARAIKETEKPAVYVHLDAKPLSSEFIDSNYDAVLELWFPGESGGQPLAEVLFGVYNPAGRLPITAPAHEGQIPVYMGQRVGSGYRDDYGMVIAKYAGNGSKRPLHYFGEGLSYTQFAYSDLKLPEEVSPKGELEVSCTVTNVGQLDGDEVVQLYVTDDAASMIRPAQELAGFRRVHLEVGESKTLCFTMRVSQFAFLNRKMQWVVEAGNMTVRIGGSSENTPLCGRFRIKEDLEVDGRTRGFYAASEEFAG